MRSVCVAGALLVVLMANGWAVWRSFRNGAEPHGGTLRLTEAELPLQPVFLESSVTLLGLSWDTHRTGNQRFGPAAWLDRVKLAELGFDCSVPLTNPEARRHYSAMPPRRVFLALTCGTDDASAQHSDNRRKTALRVVDADQNPARLRASYPDLGRYAVCHGIVRLALTRHDEDGILLNSPRLDGWVLGVLPGQISVPTPANQLLTRFHRTAKEDEQPTTPRFSALVRWGRHFEPWVEDVQPLKHEN